MKTTFLYFPLALVLLLSNNIKAQKLDSILKSKKYDTIIYYNYFNYKNSTNIYVIASGNIKNGKRHGKWIYLLPNGNIIAKGKFKKGYKHGYWKYSNSDFFVQYNSYEKIKDQIVIYENNTYQILDYDDKNKQNLLMNNLEAELRGIVLLKQT